MAELFAAGITTLDIIVIFALLKVKGRKLALVLWTTFFNTALPFLGFIIGEFSFLLFSEWSSLLSGVLLGLIGLHMLLQDAGEQKLDLRFHPVFLAFIVSVDAFSVSISFGMLQFNKLLFIGASGFYAFSFSILARHFKGRLGIKNGSVLRFFVGFSLLLMGIYSCVQ